MPISKEQGCREGSEVKERRICKAGESRRPNKWALNRAETWKVVLSGFRFTLKWNTATAKIEPERQRGLSFKTQDLIQSQ
jgi:hypothetical protein